MRILTLVCLFTCSYLCSYAQNFPNTGEHITIEELRSHLEVLASDSLEGRFTTSQGQKKAALYIKNQFKNLQLHPYKDSTYYQSFNLWQWQWGKCSIQFNDSVIYSNRDMVYQSYSPIEPSIKAECVFVGYGNDSIIKHINLDNRIAFAFVDDLYHYYRLSRAVRKQGAKALIIANPNNRTQFHQLILQANSAKDRQKVYKDKPTFSAHASKNFVVKPEFAELLFGAKVSELQQTHGASALSKLPIPTITLECPVIIDSLETQNVIAHIEADKPTKETIVISAHYDHLGKKDNTIYYGADDNASGTATLITLAKAFKELPLKLNRNLLFLATSGEELGLLGAFHFAEQQKLLSFDVKANFNIDMIGRNDSIDKKNYLYLIGAKHHPLLDSICRVANQIDSLTLHKGYNRGYGSFIKLSDHYAFHKQGIPVLGFFSGLHADYHQPSDTIDKIEFDAMQKRVELIFRTIYLACQTEILKQ